MALVMALMTAGGEPMAPASPQPLHAHGVGGAGGAGGGEDLEVRHVVGARHAVVHVGAGEQLAAVVIDGPLGQGLAYALDETAMHLTLDDHGVDDIAEIVDGGHPLDGGDTGIGVDLHLADIGAGGEGEIGRVEEGALFHAGLEALGVIVRDIGSEHHLAHGLGLVGTGDGEIAVLELDVAFSGLEQMGGDLLALLDELVAGLDDGLTTDGQ